MLSSDPQLHRDDSLITAAYAKLPNILPENAFDGSVEYWAESVDDILALGNHPDMAEADAEGSKFSDISNTIAIVGCDSILLDKTSSTGTEHLVHFTMRFQRKSNIPLADFHRCHA